MNQNKSIFMKYGTLILITLQTTILVLTLRYSRKNSSQDEAYFNSTAVFLSEFVKFFICMAVIIYSGNLKHWKFFFSNLLIWNFHQILSSVYIMSLEMKCLVNLKNCRKF